MRWIVAGLLALAGCAQETPGQAAWRMCKPIADYALWSRCIDFQTGQRAARQSPVRDPDDDAAMLLLGTSAFLSGYNQGRPRITCTSIAGITTCQ